MANDPGKDSAQRAVIRAMAWRGVWASDRVYRKGNVVEQDGWLMVANKETSDNAAPQKVGDEVEPIDRQLSWPDQSVVAERIIYGQRYTVTDALDAYLSGVSVRVYNGISYRAFINYAPNDPDGDWVLLPEVTGSSVVPSWFDIPTSPRLLLNGSVFEFIVIARSAGALTGGLVGLWDYQTPNSAGVPSSGVITHATKAQESLRVSTVDDDAVDRSSELRAVQPGNSITVSGTVWSVTNVVEYATYFDFTVTPPAQHGTGGVILFTFETFLPATIDYGRIDNHWLSNPDIDGVDGIADPSSPVLDDHAYPADVVLQQATISPDWDFMASTNVGSGGSGGDGSGGDGYTKPEVDLLLTEKQDVTHGFVDRKESTITFDAVTRTFQIDPTSGTYSYYFGSTLKTAGTLSIVLPDVPETYWIYIDAAGALAYTLLADDDLVLNKTLVAAVLYGNTPLIQGVLVLDQRHEIYMSNATRLYLLRTEGAQFGGGLALLNMDVNGDGDDESAAQLAVEEGAIYNEDLRTDVLDGTPQNLSPVAQIPLLYRQGAAGDWTSAPGTNYPVTIAGSGRAAFNKFSDGVWSLAEVNNNDFTFTHLFATADLNTPIIGMVGQGEYTTLNQARDAALTELIALGLGEISGMSQELYPIATIIWQTADSYSNAVKSRVRSTDDGDDYIDWRQLSIQPVGDGGVGDAVWGVITGTLADQVDLQAALDAQNIAISDQTLVGGGQRSITASDGSSLLVELDFGLRTTALELTPANGVADLRSSSGSGASNVLVNDQGIHLNVRNSGALHLQADPGTDGQVITSKGATSKPLWEDQQNLANADQVLQGDRTITHETGVESLTTTFTDALTQLVLEQSLAQAWIRLSAAGLFGGGNQSQLIVAPDRIEMLFSAAAALLIDGDVGVAGQAITSNGPGAAPTWESPGEAFPPVRYLFSDFHYLGSTTNSPFLLLAIAGGSNTTAAPTAAVQVGTSGILLLRSTTTANSGFGVRGNRATMVGQADLYFRSIAAVPNNFTNKVVRMGFSNSASNASMPIHGAYFEVNASSTVTANTRVNNSQSTSPDVFVLVADTYYRFEIHWTSTVSINFRVLSLDGSAVHLDTDITTNIPLDPTEAFGGGVWATSGGTAVDDLLWLDYLGIGFKNLR